MKLINADKEKLVVELSREDFTLLRSCVNAASQDYSEIDPSAILASKEKVDDIWDKMFRIGSEYTEKLKLVDLQNQLNGDK